MSVARTTVLPQQKQVITAGHPASSLHLFEPAVDELPEGTRTFRPEDVICGGGDRSTTLGSHRASSGSGTERIGDEASKECGLDAFLERRADGWIDRVLATERGDDPRRQDLRLLVREIGGLVPLALSQLMTVGGIELLALVAQLAQTRADLRGLSAIDETQQRARVVGSGIRCKISDPRQHGREP